MWCHIGQSQNECLENNVALIKLIPEHDSICLVTFYVDHRLQTLPKVVLTSSCSILALL